MKLTGLFIAALALALIGMAPPQAQTKPQPAETEIKARSDAFAAAWNKHDAKALAACWTTDGDLIDPFGQSARGRTGIEKFFQTEHAGPFKTSTFTITSQSTRMIKPDVAVADWDVNLTGVKTPEGSDAPPCAHHVTLVMIKDGADWLVVTARPVMYAPRPGTQPMQ